MSTVHSSPSKHSSTRCWQPSDVEHESLVHALLSLHDFGTKVHTPSRLQKSFVHGFPSKQSLVLWMQVPVVWLQLSIYLSMTLFGSLALLQPVKGAVVALQWALRMHGFDDTPADGIPPV